MVAPSGNEDVTLKQHLGLHNGVVLIVGCIIGCGIFVSPKGVLLATGSVGCSIVVWTACGLISLIGALCYAELGTYILKSGGDYAYIREAFGGLPGFLYLWVAMVVILPTTNAILALTFAYNLVQPIFPTCEPPDSAVKLLAASAILLLTFINCCRVSWADRVQILFTIATFVALLLIIGVGIFQFSQGEFEHFKDPFFGTNTGTGALSLGFYSGMFSYGGWNYLNFVTEEIRDPYKNLPRAIWISIPLVTIFYVTVNIAYFSVLSPEELLASNAVAVTLANRVLGKMAWCMPILVAASTFSGLNGTIFSSARLAYVGAREGHFPRAIAMVNIKLRTPIPALVFDCIISVAMLVTNNVYVLINYVNFVESAFMGLSVLGLLYLRWKRPDDKRPIKVPLVLPIFFVLIIAFLIVFPLIASTTECFVAIAIIATGVPVYWFMILWKDNPLTSLKYNEKFTIFLQKVLLMGKKERED